MLKYFIWMLKNENTSGLKVHPHKIPRNLSYVVFVTTLVGRAGLFVMCISLQYFLKSHIRFWVWGVLVWDGVRQHWWVKEKSGLKSYLPSTTSQQQIPHCRILQGVRPQRSWAEYHWCANKRATHFGNHNDPGFPSVAQQKTDVFHH